MGAIKSKFFRSKSGSRKEKGDKKVKEKKQKKTVNLPDSHSARKIVDPRLPFSNYRQIFSIRNAWKAIQRSMEECATETFIRFLNNHTNYKEKYASISGIQDGDLEELRKNQDFEDKAMDIYVIFDGVIANLEDVDKALQEIQYGAPATQFSHKMVKDYQGAFMETIRLHLGSDRFTETTENNYKLLYEFIQEELCKHIEDDESTVIDDSKAEVDESETVVDDSRMVADTEVEVNLCMDDTS
ncbi:uncharacterized protein LOC128547740 [Mercenaria mercenaria]|uniref:uncharacterized protein LOC128547740 n=1 Tax=Mercenaria mercenaria TaxID=6596 RepID=UPI00234F7137|nr:uncharacterized protein LOC128547740 [Mercenaria mercenaria]